MPATQPIIQPAIQKIAAKLQQVWGYSSFRPPQGEIVQALLARQDTLVVMPTGGGKSICFQLPALLETGLTLVVSPLVALMENQVQELQQRRLPVALLHSELSSQQTRKTLWLLETQKLRLLYLSPETLLSRAVWERLCRPELVINGLILDEAHCLVQWGDSFRPAYRRLGAVRPALLAQKPAGSQIAIAAFTATADPQAQRIIQQVLGLESPQVFLHSPYRPNLHLGAQIAWSSRGRKQQLWQFIQQHSGTGLVYVRTRAASEELAAWLTQQGYKTAAYHAGLSPEARRQLEADWLSGSLPCVICTSAFGMGINKPDVRWVMHFHLPLLLSEYVQEVGRAGRDGQPAKALALVSEPTGWLDSEDNQRQQFFQSQMRKQQQTAQALIRQIPATGEVVAVSRQFRQAEMALALLHSAGQLTWLDPFHYQIAPNAKVPVAESTAAKQMQRYLHSRTCRWDSLLSAFGFSAGFRCGHCDRCKP
ncbi:MAG: RecQ family ATP-dependent DNA helicase [Pegethrix bostrychoides GSE-TBD4-15B]|jgi:ATP-dependent DNA helicase RecQ|uniref:ATP-dependent DNA helicase RecQ n=1 Tax=Pegethrix bostrychoides GSE-TBD4-15B TaxID=2839662 RepID=A0A951PBV6_9CYAN|nr:RecQ family ATP-dependent DNA helicase [Pegethrix bostrychoides GSE-TBD4-15B]